MGKLRAWIRQPGAQGWMSKFALLVFILFILALVSPVLTLLITLLAL